MDFDRVIRTLQASYENAVGVFTLVWLVELKDVLSEINCFKSIFRIEKDLLNCMSINRIIVRQFG